MKLLTIFLLVLAGTAYSQSSVQLAPPSSDGLRITVTGATNGGGCSPSQSCEFFVRITNTSTKNLTVGKLNLVIQPALSNSKLDSSNQINSLVDLPDFKNTDLSKPDAGFTLKAGETLEHQADLAKLLWLRSSQSTGTTRPFRELVPDGDVRIHAELPLLFEAQTVSKQKIGNVDVTFVDQFSFQSNTVDFAIANTQDQTRQEVERAAAFLPGDYHAAVTAFIEIGPRSIPYIVTLINSKEQTTLQRVSINPQLLMIIARFQTTTAQDALIEMLDHPLPLMRGNAVEYLGVKRSTRAIPRLIDLLDDNQVYAILNSSAGPEHQILIRDNVVEALEEITGIELLPQESYERKAAAWREWSKERGRRAIADGRLSVVQINDGRCDERCVETTRSLLTSAKTGIGTSWSEKSNREMGDRIILGIMRVVPENERFELSNVRTYFTIIKEAFADTDMIRDPEFRDPKMAVEFLRAVSENVDDDEMRNEAKTLAEHLLKR